MRWKIILLSLLSAMALAGCKKEVVSTPETPPELAEPATPPARTSPAVEIVELGAEPRGELRSIISPRLKQKLKIRVDAEIEVAVAFLNMRQAPRSLTFELTIERKGVEAAEGSGFTFLIENVRADLAKELPVKTREAWQSATAAMRGTEGSYLVDSLGAVRGVEMKAPSGASREYWAMAADLDWALQQLGVPFPTEAIGGGAGWTVKRRVTQDGVDAKQVSTLEMIKLEKQLVTIRKAFQQSAAPQAFRNPGSTVESELAELAGEGAGEITWDLTQHLPRSAKMTSTVTKGITYPSEGKRVAATMVTHRTLSAAGR